MILTEYCAIYQVLSRERPETRPPSARAAHNARRTGLPASAARAPAPCALRRLAMCGHCGACAHPARASRLFVPLSLFCTIEPTPPALARGRGSARARLGALCRLPDRSTATNRERYKTGILYNLPLRRVASAFPLLAQFVAPPRRAVASSLCAALGFSCRSSPSRSLRCIQNQLFCIIRGANGLLFRSVALFSLRRRFRPAPFCFLAACVATPAP